MTEGHEYFLCALRNLGDEELEEPSALPGWTRKHVLSHVGHNARALARLTHWAATGELTPMYPSPSARDEEIEAGTLWSAARLRAFVEEEQVRLSIALERLTCAGWRAEVVTAQGRTVPATVIPWLRSRELWVHATDLRSGADFAGFPADFTDALITDAVTRRRTAQLVEVSARATDRAVNTFADGDVVAEGTAADLARWLTGRGTHPQLVTTAGDPLPELPPWL
ncbi:maleylpyruvate isomerase family mycothiol-dependent enzyme [Streptomyces sp. WZ-12]|uniref:maleylpyruvate isomerase family mycothiol-dependent enzyme n=1 Tax=Streptomyces sp. WZ-12 TaxID=3030210 RepID=UPI0023815096|nr:maleylpyruvate isomerase family mycothiol-dependent enzyme [Streptomyces sp. WZ-12]